MTDANPTRQAIAAVDRSLPGKVTGRLRAALIEMVWKGSRRAEAAKAAGMTDHSLRTALRKPHVIAFYLAELGTLRESERAKTFHRLCDLRDQDDNRNAAVAAARTLEQISDEQAMRPNAANVTPGVVIRIVNVQQSPADAGRVISVTQPEPESASLPAAPPAQHDSPVFRP